MDDSLALEVELKSPATVPCQNCDRAFSSIRSLQCHVKVHNEKILKCFYCENMFNRTDALFLHILDHISKGIHPCRTDGCDVVVESMLEGENHAITNHFTDGSVQLKCRECFETVTSFRKMLLHHTFKHGELKTYAEEMTEKQRKFLREKKNQSRKEKKSTTGVGSSTSAKEDDFEHEIAKSLVDGCLAENSQTEENDDENMILEQVQIALAGTTESNTEMIEKLSDVIAELFPRTSKEQYQCLHCMLGFTDAILWMTHLGYHDVENPFKCSGCGRQFEIAKLSFSTSHITHMETKIILNSSK
ncbi:hypothetical protein L5515_004223 [Caenorhabditis briggsae]|uniref:C2H2-type domain-containing protein n=1 Tax=Caenorhabditis briggsae TaxID=6238 RepID=A0AAE9EJR2_CAEBR|nr:hypothetical protein L5515_004223 [Caenorhabditis briggsae]